VEAAAGTGINYFYQGERVMDDDNEMGLQEALACAICSMQESLDEAKQMSDYEKQFLQISEDELVRAINTLAEHKRLMWLGVM
jgi:hypothetical protein